MEAILCFLLIVPGIALIYLSFTSWTPLMGDWWNGEFIGLENYFDILQDERFLSAVGRTLLITVIAVPAEFLLGLALAVFFASRWNLWGRKIYVSLLLIPMMILPTVVGYNFFTVFFRDGPLNDILSYLSGTDVAIDWLKNPSTALLAVILADIWQWTSFMFIILYSGLLALPEEPLKAARVLGATEWRIFRRITLPMLKPVIYLTLVIRSLEAFKLFDVPFIMTSGGPGTATETISIYMYLQGFAFGRLAYIGAGALLILIAITLVVMFVARPLLHPATQEGK
jgi:multiple sugar transport system permease protein